MDIISRETASQNANGAAELSAAIPTNNQEQICEYMALCTKDTLLPKSFNPSQNQVKMPAIALVLETICSKIKPSNYNTTDEQKMIDLLVLGYGVDPNASFQIHGQTKPLFEGRSFTAEVSNMDIDSVKIYTPLSLLLSYYIEYREVDQHTIRNCMEHLIQLGAKPSIASSYYYKDGNRTDCSLLMAALQNRFSRDTDQVDFFSFLLEKGATFSENDEAPLANFLNDRQVFSVEVLDLFYKYSRVKRQITPRQILASIPIDGQKRDAIYIWCNHPPPDGLVDVRRAMGLLLDLGFEAQSGFTGINDAIQAIYNVAKYYYDHLQTINKYMDTRVLLWAANEQRSERMMDVLTAQLFDRHGLSKELNGHIHSFTRISEERQDRASKILEARRQKQSQTIGFREKNTTYANSQTTHP